uniref:Protein kinase domain-containing protein n=1 Tax=Timema poppense TaxID=170557 RepID=A0A7R9DVB9_TIMPO|nr:unnamed protein product [Timema poppensis]
MSLSFPSILAQRSSTDLRQCSREFLTGTLEFVSFRTKGRGHHLCFRIITLNFTIGKNGGGYCDFRSSIIGVFVDKFLFREIDILSKVHHPHIIHVFGIHRFRSVLFVFTRLAECGDLLEFVQRNGPVSEGTARLWSRQIALALHYLNCLDIVHRLHPSYPVAHLHFCGPEALTVKGAPS